MDMEAKNVPIKAKVICGGQTTTLTLVLKHLRGRGSITVLSRERIMNAKLEGWPEVCKKKFLNYFGTHFTYLFRYTLRSAQAKEK